MQKGLFLLMTIGFWVFVGWLLVKAAKKGSKKMETLQDKLLKSKKITKEQYKKIEAFEETFETEEKLKRWENAGLIDTKEIYKNLPARNFASMVNSLFYLGIGCIILGIIAVVAANYDKIPPIVRLSTTFIVYVICNVGVYLSHIRNKVMAKEGFLWGSIGLIGALIGLTIQTFHLDSSIENAVFLWSSLSLPFVALSTKKWLADMWYPAFFLSFLASTYGREFLLYLSNLNSPVVLMIITALVFDIYLALRKFVPQHPLTQALSLWSKVWAICAVVFVDSIYVEASAYYRGFSVHKSIMGQMDLFSLYAVFLASLAPIALAVFKTSSLALKYVIFIAAFGLFGAFFSYPILGIILTLTTISFVAVYFARQNDIRSFNFMVILFFVRLLFAYFNLFMSLLATGIGAIVLGITILLGVKFWISYKQNLINYIQKGK